MRSEPVDFLPTHEPTFGQRLRAFRTERGLSCAKLAEVLGTAGYTIRRWEVGTSRPSKAHADKLCTLGFGAITAEETDLGSLSRIKHQQESGARRSAEFSLPELPSASFASWVANGPSDQEPFHRKLVQLQIACGSPDEDLLRRLSLVESYGEGKRTSQSLLENPKPTAAAWNSNYGSHGWHRYVGRFPPHLIRALLNHFNADQQTVVCDPFMGSGTTAVECRLLGIPFVGIEICALSHLISSVKAGFDAKPCLSDLANRYEEFMASCTLELGHQFPASYGIDEVISRKGNVIATFPNIGKWFTAEAFLGVSLTMEFAEKLEGFQKSALLVALSAKMRSIGNVDVDVVRAEYSREPRKGVKVGKLVARQLRRMAGDIEDMTESHALGASSSILLFEGSALAVTIKPKSVNYIITSPPYGVEALSYLRTHLLSYRSLASVLSHDPYETREETIGSEYLEEAKLPETLNVERISPTFRAFFSGNQAGPDKNSRLRRLGMMKFFEDMQTMSIRMSDWLKDSGRIAFIVGNKRLGEQVIPTTTIVEETFKHAGFVKYDEIRHKLKTNNSNSQVPWQERIIQEESVLLFKREVHR